MRLQMIGIDHSTAQIAVRERFAFTRSAAEQALQTLKHTQGIRGCVLLSTCNRMELYVSLDEETQIDLCDWVCTYRQQPVDPDRAYFCAREGMDAAHHLFELACGLCSQILGEDQILTQVGDAIALAREIYTTDNCLEVLFRQAVTVTKQIKSSITFEKGNRSAASAAIGLLRSQGAEFAGKRALVIGNGMMGRLTAQALMQEQMQVTVTVRQYRSGIVDIPEGAARINYGERYQMLPEADYIFSATASPNLTITPEGLAGQEAVLKDKVFVDLAVPRDIDPAIGDLPGVRLICMDDLHVEPLSATQQEQYARAQERLAQACEEFSRFYYNRDLLPRIAGVSATAAEDLWGRMHRDCADLSCEQRENVRAAAVRSGSKVYAHLLYLLRDGLDADTFSRCLELLEEDQGR